MAKAASLGDHLAMRFIGSRYGGREIGQGGRRSSGFLGGSATILQFVCAFDDIGRLFRLFGFEAITKRAVPNTPPAILLNVKESILRPLQEVRALRLIHPLRTFFLIPEVSAAHIFETPISRIVDPETGPTLLTRV